MRTVHESSLQQLQQGNTFGNSLSPVDVWLSLQYDYDFDSRNSEKNCYFVPVNEDLFM